MQRRKQRILRTLRVSGLLLLADKFRYLITALRSSRRNSAFRSSHPSFALPPKNLAYDAYSAPDWVSYQKSGIETAAFLASIAEKYLPASSLRRVLEWGCGPARVVRHVPSAFGATTQAYGCDYNPRTIEWCSGSIQGVAFNLNGLHPPLPFSMSFFDFIYSISVFTHLSESVSHEWIDELFRISHSGTILVISTNGDSFRAKLLPDELEIYNSRGVVTRGNVEEGKRNFSSCHSPAYLRDNLFRNFKVLEFIPAGFPFTGQDCWVISKP